MELEICRNIDKNGPMEMAFKTERIKIYPLRFHMHGIQIFQIPKIAAKIVKSLLSLLRLFHINTYYTDGLFHYWS
jgi:hypothetical protein